jgi:hypothetical protein
MSPWGWTRIKGSKHVGQWNYTINVIKLYICRTINMSVESYWYSSPTQHLLIIWNVRSVRPLHWHIVHRLPAGKYPVSSALRSTLQTSAVTVCIPETRRPRKCRAVLSYRPFRTATYKVFSLSGALPYTCICVLLEVLLMAECRTVLISVSTNLAECLSC